LVGVGFAKLSNQEQPQWVVEMSAISLGRNISTVHKATIDTHAATYEFIKQKKA
jgi:hypothetical protein